MSVGEIVIVRGNYNFECEVFTTNPTNYTFPTEPRLGNKGVL